MYPRGLRREEVDLNDLMRSERCQPARLIPTTLLRHIKWQPSPPFPALFPTDVLIEFSETRSQSLCATTAADGVRWIQCLDATFQPRETTTLIAMSRISSAAQPRALTLTEELEKLEQSITLTLQGALPLVSSRSLRLMLAEIDHNFSRAHRIVTSSILPIVEQYGGHSKEVWEGSRVRPSPLRKKEY